MNENENKYSGVSFGGIIQRVLIMGKKYTLVYGYDRKEDKYGYGIKENSRFSFLKKMYFIFPLFDLGGIIGYFFMMWILSMGGGGTGPPSDPLIPSYVWEIIMYGLIFSMYVILYFLIMRGVRTWHGSEHKIIASMEKNDLDNAKNYDPIHERCGGTLLPTIFVAAFIWLYIASYTGIIFGQYTFITICVYMNVKLFHKYDKIGIWVGKWVQRHFTISEPEDWKLKLGQAGARQFLKAEKGENFIEEEYLEVQK